jgi:aryl-alcohol dehydrogenase-like predicted oxidoreductase
MRTKRLGWEGPEVSVIGFGAREAGVDLTVEAQNQSIRAMQAGFDGGMTWVDTADVYDSEPIVGRALVGRPQTRVFTKVYHRLYEHGLTPPNIRRAAQVSIRRIGRDIIDLFLVLEPDPGRAARPETLDALR